MRVLRSIRIGCSILFVAIWVVIFLAVFAVAWFAPGDPAVFPAPVVGQAVYDPAWSCPLAPPENRLSVPIRAGERRTPSA